MTTVGTRLRSSAVTAAVVLVTASWLAAAPTAHATAPAPSSTAQPSPTPQPTTAAAGTAVSLPLGLDPTSARPGDTVAVTFQGWKSDSCFLYVDQGTAPTGSCTASNGILTGSLIVPTDATTKPAVLITACPTNCVSDNFTGTASLKVLAPLATSRPTGGQVGGAVTITPPHHRRRHQRAAPVTSTSSHTTAFVAGGAAVVFIASVLGLLLLRRRPPTMGQPPDIELVPHADPGVVTVDPAHSVRDLERVTIRLRPDTGRCRVEAMQR
jgi:hypothetical protein